MNDQTAELRDYLRVIGKYRYHIILGTWLCVMAAYVATARMVPIYESSIKLLVSQRSMSAPGTVMPSAGESFQSIMVSERLAKTYSDMLQGRMVALRVIKAGRLKMTSSQMLGKIKAEPIRETQLIRVSAQDPNPAQAQRIANTLGRVFSKIVEEIEGQDKVVSLVRVTQVEPAVLPTAPVKPKPGLNIALGLAVGVIFSAGVAFFLDYLDVSIKTSAEVEELLNVPVMGVIPRAKELGESKLAAVDQPSSILAEAFRSLRTNIQYLNFDGSLKILAITSSLTGEGKTSVSTNLAAVLAQAGASVLIIDCDLRRPTVHKYAQEKSAIGLSNVLAGATEFSEAVIKTKVPQMFVLPSGPIPPNPAELLGSPRMQEVIAQARKKMDFVILDSPPALAVTDAAVLARLVDGFAFVIKAGSTNRHIAIQAKAALERVGAKLVGAVLNNVTAGHAGYGYYYAQDYYGRAPEAQKEAAPTNADVRA